MHISGREMNRRLIATATLFMCLMMGKPSVADECNTGFVEVVGRAAIVIDPVTARDRALVDAKARASEACGVSVEERSVATMGMSLDHVAQIKAFAFIRAYEIISERSENGIYYVKIKAWIKAGDEKRAARKDLLSRRLILMLSEGKGADIIEDIMKEKLLQAGFSLLDRKFLQTKLTSGTWQCLKTGNTDCVGSEYYPFLADYLISISSRVRFSQKPASGIKSFRAGSEIRCTQISSAKMCSHAKKSDVIFGTDEEHAVYGSGGDQFLKAVAEPLASEFLHQLSKLFATRKREVRITIRDLPNREAFDDFRLLVKELRWVDGVANENFLDGVGMLSVHYSEKSIYLASMIAFREIYAVKKYTWDMIEVSFRRSG